MLEKTGVATPEQIKNVYPDEERWDKGAFAVIECFQNIPCNPCKSSCPRGAISMENIDDQPKVDFDKCNGCGICMGICPGLAIFIIDETFSSEETLIKMPYEFLPLPKTGDKVRATSREGKDVCEATVQNVVTSKSSNRTPIVWLSVPKEFGMEARCFTFGENLAAEKSCVCDCTPIEKIDESTSSNTYICRCEEITVALIRECIAKGYTTLDEIKRVSRAGMGACQGRTCRGLIMNEIASATGKKHEDQLVTTFRPMVSPIKMGLLCREGSDE